MQWFKHWLAKLPKPVAGVDYDPILWRGPPTEVPEYIRKHGVSAKSLGINLTRNRQTLTCRTTPKV
ncbi:hypothetical protein [Dyella humicola]|uniref:hypothetical protein n=1 Tax=Dyella humicola TaxID=2992126 RepID=UPI00224CCC44|nr:hypothetical protein [Dyella humicola]